MKNAFTILFIAMLSVLISCNETTNESNDDITKDGVLVPLATGNEWTYRGIDLKTNVIYEEVITISLRDARIENNMIWYPSDNLKFFFIDGAHYIGNKNDGFWYSESRFKEGSLIGKYPIDVGDTYQTEFDNEMKYDVFLKSNNKKIIIDTKSYITYHYEFTWISNDINLSNTLNYFFEPNVGLIKRTVRTINNGDELHFGLELINYTLN